MDPTYHKLDIDPGDEGPEGIASYINSDDQMVAAFGRAVVEQREADSAPPRQSVFATGGEPEKWLPGEFEEAMRTLSAAYPTALFTVKGEELYAGEEAFWIAYFTGGKVQLREAEVVYPPFDKISPLLDGRPTGAGG